MKTKLFNVRARLVIANNYRRYFFSIASFIGDVFIAKYRFQYRLYNFGQFFLITNTNKILNTTKFNYIADCKSKNERH